MSLKQRRGLFRLVYQEFKVGLRGAQLGSTTQLNYSASHTLLGAEAGGETSSTCIISPVSSTSVAALRSQPLAEAAKRERRRIHAGGSSKGKKSRPYMGRKCRGAVHLLWQRGLRFLDTF